VDSSRAAARIVALTMLADGHLSQAELDVLQRGGGYDRLGVEPALLHDVLHALCEDLLVGARLAWSDACRVDEHALTRLMAELESPVLREQVLAVCVEVAQADEDVSDGESLVLTHAVEQWGLQARMLRASPALHGAPAVRLPCSA
jgi:hypothetical protein